MFNWNDLDFTSKEKTDIVPLQQTLLDTIYLEPNSDYLLIADLLCNFKDSYGESDVLLEYRHCIQCNFSIKKGYNLRTFPGFTARGTIINGGGINIIIPVSTLENEPGAVELYGYTNCPAVEVFFSHVYPLKLH